MRLIDADAAYKAACEGADNWDGAYSPYRDDRIREEMDKVPTFSPWHRCKDELPEPIHPTNLRYKAYLICDSIGHMHVADYTYSKRFPTCYSFYVNGEEETDVKYWMPIEPPKEDA